MYSFIALYIFLSLYCLFHIATVSHWLLKNSFYLTFSKLNRSWIKTHQMKRTETTAKSFSFNAVLFFGLASSFLWSVDRYNDSARPQTSLKTEHDWMVLQPYLRGNITHKYWFPFVQPHTIPKLGLIVDQMKVFKEC